MLLQEMKVPIVTIITDDTGVGAGVAGTYGSLTVDC